MSLTLPATVTGRYKDQNPDGKTMVACALYGVIVCEGTFNIALDLTDAFFVTKTRMKRFSYHMYQVQVDNEFYSDNMDNIFQKFTFQNVRRNYWFWPDE